MFGFMVTHELDAVKRHEWRVLPLTSFLPDEIGERVFIWAHVPLLTAILYLGGTDPTSLTAIGMSVFSIVHIGLHWAFRKHAKYEFNNPGSWLLICGSGVFGALHLIVLQMGMR